MFWKPVMEAQLLSGSATQVKMSASIRPISIKSDFYIFPPKKIK